MSHRSLIISLLGLIVLFSAHVRVNCAKYGQRSVVITKNVTYFDGDTEKDFCEDQHLGRIAAGSVAEDAERCRKVTCTKESRIEVEQCFETVLVDQNCEVVREKGPYPDCCNSFYNCNYDGDENVFNDYEDLNKYILDDSATDSLNEIGTQEDIEETTTEVEEEEKNKESRRVLTRWISDDYDDENSEDIREDSTTESDVTDKEDESDDDEVDEPVFIRRLVRG